MFIKYYITRKKIPNYALKCYTEVGTSFDDFIEQFFDDELAEKFTKKYKYNYTQYHLKYKAQLLRGYKLVDMDLYYTTELLFLGYEDNVVYIGEGRSSETWCSFSFQTYELTCGIESIREIRSIPLDMEGFVFHGKIRNNN